MPRYVKPPITEAIIDLQVKLPPEVSLSDVELLADTFKERYPTKKKLMLISAQLKHEEGKPLLPESHQSERGFYLVNADEKWICQLTLNSFTMSRLPPYDCWEELRDEARRLWVGFREILKPSSLTRAAVRYINRIDAPLPFKDFKDYLRATPEIPPELPQGLSSYLFQVQIPQPDLHGVVNITESLISPTHEGVASIALDIELFRTQNLPADDAGLWGLLELLRDRKNKIFEACITDAARELFK